jgi:uncharacterized Fe-S center protein
MKSLVYFTPVKESGSQASLNAALQNLLEKSGVLDFVDGNDQAVIKMHFGEEGNTGFVRPGSVRVISDMLVKKGASVDVADTNTLYRGRRTTSNEHEKLAREHGFSVENTGARLVVPNELDSGNCRTIILNKKYVKEAKVVALFAEADSLIGLAHFKGHLMTGFGGALKNIGMGCASREGKLAQHSAVSPVVYAGKCVGCGECEKVCPVNAVSIINGKSKIDKARCIGCASCIAACTYGAMDVNWGAGRDTIMERMTEYALALLKKRKKVAFVNFAVKITAECDCLAKDDPRIAPDVGILASADPVAIDQASYDLVLAAAGGSDVFAAAHPGRDGKKQLAYAEQLGIGSRQYELRTIPANQEK